MITTGSWSSGCWRFVPDCTDGFSLALWIKFLDEPTLDDPCHAHGIISSFQSNKASGFTLTSWNCIPAGSFKHIALGILDPYSGKFLYKGDILPSLNTWAHYVFTLDYVPNGYHATMFNVYKNGVIVTSPLSHHWPPFDQPASAETRDILVFGRGLVDADADRPKVVIDNVLIFNYSVNVAEVDLLYHM